MTTTKLLMAVDPSKSAPIDTKLGPKRVSDDPRRFIFSRTNKNVRQLLSDISEL